MSTLTKLPEPLKPPTQRWQKLPTRPRGNENAYTTPPRTQPKLPTKSPAPGKPATAATKCPSAKKTPRGGCRFIPTRQVLEETTSYTPKSVLTFQNVTPSRTQGSFLDYTNNTSIGSARSFACETSKREKRKVPTSAEKILDAPCIVDDYYLNVLDWSRNNQLAIALGPTVYLWNSETGSTTELLDLGDEDEGSCVCSLSFAEKGKYLAVGTHNGDIQLWDLAKEKRVRTMKGHSDRVSSLHWNAHTLASGCRNGQIHLHDVRKANHCTGKAIHHQMEVCGLRWSPDGLFLASGGNDNLVCVWSPRLGTEEPAQLLTGHQAAVKALSWCPWQSSILATGGGSTDRNIKVWNALTGECLQSLDTKSQVSSVAWSVDKQELISSHGEPHNQLSIWKYPSMTCVAELLGHSGRVLHVAMSPRRTRVASASADETLRVWKCFDRPTSSSSGHSVLENTSQLSLHFC